MTEELTVACKMKGKDIQSLLFADAGILKYEGNTLTFIDPKTMESKTYAMCTPAYIGKIVFVYNHFELKTLLDPEEVYRIIFYKDFLYFETLDGRLDAVFHGLVL
jgi:hypothetical protein